LCDGSAVSRTTYAALYVITGDTYGNGDGSTTFNLPDLRGRTVVAPDDLGRRRRHRDRVGYSCWIVSNLYL
jgi:microcystin-dependent protein